MCHTLSQKGDLGNSTFTILYHEISSGCENAELQLGALGYKSSCGFKRMAELSKYSYLQAL